MSIRRIVNRVGLVLSLACFGLLAIGIGLEAVRGVLLFEEYISMLAFGGFFFGVIYERTRRT